MLLGLIVTTGVAAAFDPTYATLASVYAGAVDARGVDYDLVATRRPALDAALAEIAAVDASGFGTADKVALYVNAYNAYTVRLILDERPLKSIRDLDGGNPWKARTFVVAGETLTLDQMEHERVRPLADGRVHAVINCASVGCPPLPPAPLVAATLGAQLDAGARRWVSTNAFAVEDGVLRLSRIFEWYAADFAAWGGTPRPGADAAQSAAIGFLTAFGLTEVPAHSAVAWRPYDWSLNAR